MYIKPFLDILVPLIFIVVISIIFIFNLKKIKFIKSIRKNTFEIYKNKYPDLVKDGKVKCNQCGSDDIGIITRYAPYATDHEKPVAIAHVCKTCGHTLYYSKFDK